MNDNIQLSVIIPVYNTQEYLERCINGVLANKGINMEIILIDDGSTDASPSLCDNYSSTYPFITTLHIPNSGSLNPCRHAVGRRGANSLL